MLFKGRLPAAAPVLEDADRIPVELRPIAQVAPWEERRPKQSQGWDRKPWQPEARPSAQAGVRKRLRRTRASDELGLGSAPAEEWTAAAPAGVMSSVSRSAARAAEALLLRDVLHEWRVVASFASGRSVPARRSRGAAPSGVWAVLADAYADGVAAARRRGGGRRPAVVYDAEEEDEKFEEGPDDGVAAAAETTPHAPPPLALLAAALRVVRIALLELPRIVALLLLAASVFAALLHAAAVAASGSMDGALARASGADVLLRTAAAGGADVVSAAVSAYGPNADAAVARLRRTTLAASVSPLGAAAARTGALVPLLATGGDPGLPGRCWGVPSCSLAAAWPLADCVAAGRAGLPGGCAERLLHAGAPASGPGWRMGPRGVLLSASPLLLAAAARDRDAVAQLLQASASGASGGSGLTLLGGMLGGATPLWAALSASSGEQHPSPALVAALLTGGAQPRRGAGLGPAWLLATESPLGAAARKGHPLVIAPLLASGALTTEGLTLGPGGLLAAVTPLAVACWRGNGAVAQALLQAGAPPDVGAVVGLGGVFGSASPLFLVLAGTGAPGERAAFAEALLRRLGAEQTRAGLRLGPVGIVAHITPLGAAALRDDAAAVTRLLAAGAEPARCVRIFALWLRCTRVGGAHASAVLREWQTVQGRQWTPAAGDASRTSGFPPPGSRVAPITARAAALLHRAESQPVALDEAEELSLLEAWLQRELQTD